MSTVNEPEAYLKSGSNELKILEYAIGELHLGINILKVSRVLETPERLSRPGAGAHPAVIGLFQDHGHIVPLVELSHLLGIESRQPRGRTIITEFFDAVTGFRVDAVEKVHTLSWGQVISAEDVLQNLDNPYILSIARPEGGANVLMADYEKIVLELAPQLKQSPPGDGTGDSWRAEGLRILLAEDSAPVRDMLTYELSERGFTVTTARDGDAASAAYDTDDAVALVIADVEMPKKDGLALLGHIRRHPRRPSTPVLIYSSIGDLGMKERARVMAANAHITKLEIDELLSQVSKALKI